MRIHRSLYGAGLLALLIFSSPLLAGQAQDPALIVPASPADTPQQHEVFAFLHDYFSALATGEVVKLATYHPALTPEQLDFLRHYFDNTIRDLHIKLQDVRVQVAANTATVDFYRVDHFVDRLSGRRVKKGIQLSTMLVQGANGWQLAGLDQVAFALSGSQIRPS